MEQTIKFTVSILCFFVLSACTFENDERTTAFIGDSLVARWDLQEYFPSRKTENFGLSGSGISHIEEYRGFFNGKDVVVIIGTNDLARLGKSKEPEYAARYVSAISQLNAENVYLYSIFPRSFANDPDSINHKIARINTLIKGKIASDNIHYIDVFESLSKGDSIDMQYSYDGLHLSPYGYELDSSRLKELLE